MERNRQPRINPQEGEKMREGLDAGLSKAGDKTVQTNSGERRVDLHRRKSLTEGQKMELILAGVILVGAGIGGGYLIGHENSKSNGNLKKDSEITQVAKGIPTTSEAAGQADPNTTTLTTENSASLIVDDHEMKPGDKYITPGPALVQGDVMILDEKTGSVVIPYDNDAKTGQMTYVDKGTVLFAKYGGDVQIIGDLNIESDLQKANLAENVTLMLQHGGVNGQGVDKVFVSEFIDGKLISVETFTKDGSTSTTVTTSQSIETTTTVAQEQQDVTKDHQFAAGEEYSVETSLNIIMGDVKIGGKNGKALYDSNPATGLIVIDRTGGHKYFAQWGADVQQGIREDFFDTLLEKDIQEMKKQHGSSDFKVIVEEVNADGKVVNTSTH